MKNTYFSNFLLSILTIFIVHSASAQFESEEELNKFNTWESDFRKTYSHLDIPKIISGFRYIYTPYDISSVENGEQKDPSVEINNFKDFSNSVIDYYGNYSISSWPKKRLLLYNPFCMPNLYPLELEQYKLQQEIYAAMANLKYSPTIEVETPKISSSYNDFFTLHECGHHDLSKYLPAANNDEDLQLIVMIGTYGLWGKHKKLPYKNILTKIGSRFLVSLVVSTAFKIGYNQIHERYADNFACKSAIDKKTLEQGIEHLRDSDKSLDKRLKNKGIPFCAKSLYSFYKDPYHPSISSRINKIQKVIQQRFPE